MKTDKEKKRTMHEEAAEGLTFSGEKFANLVRVYFGIASKISPNVDTCLFVFGLLCLNFVRNMGPVNHVFPTIT